jgi:hypothetical protein
MDAGVLSPSACGKPWKLALAALALILRLVTHDQRTPADSSDFREELNASGVAAHRVHGVDDVLVVDGGVCPDRDAVLVGERPLIFSAHAVSARQS